MRFAACIEYLKLYFLILINRFKIWFFNNWQLSFWHCFQLQKQILSRSQHYDFINQIFMMDIQAKLIVTFVWGIIIFQTSAYLILYAPLLFHHNLFYFILIVPIFITIVSLLCVSYYKSIYCEPGYSSYHINLHYNDELEQIKQRAKEQTQRKKVWRANRKQGKVNMQQIKSLNEISYCFKCDLVKEARFHHCKICKKCIQRMDHHCPWVGNCVGKLNHKYFILFLLYATTGLLIVAITFTNDWSTGQFYAKQLTKNQYYTYYFSCITSYMLASSIGFLFVTQMMTSLKNITTLQSFTEGVTKHNIFQTGSKVSNLREIFGSSNWLLPTNPFPPECPMQNGTIDVL